MNLPRIRSEVFLREDIQNILTAIDQANAALAVHLPIAEVAIYRMGFAAALRAVAAAFDVVLESQPQGSRKDLQVTKADLVQ